MSGGIPSRGSHGRFFTSSGAHGRGQAAADPTHTSGPAVLVEPPSRPESAESVGGGLDLLRARLHQHWYIRCVLILVAFLHTRHQVSFRACGLILTCLNFMFLKLPGDLLHPTDPMPVTLKTVFSRLGLQGDRFTSQILCYQCHRHFERDTPSDALCPDCETELFQPATRQLFQSVLTSITGTSAPEPARRPYLVSPVQLLSDSIREFFQRPGMVGAVNAWKIRPRTPGESRSIQDGKVWRNIKGHDGQSFFHGDSSKTEIRLGTMIGLDWFGRKTSITDHLTAVDLYPEFVGI
ncbi:hypothetical protein B0H10DRAFT_1972920 [Mycena sp. CBHHK59/15]|nr:hypothetical protein B0H10DRAFT_1972920 [Mycena sp. CBHHK59/15]